jgi:hypothetical protein
MLFFFYRKMGFLQDDLITVLFPMVFSSFCVKKKNGLFFFTFAYHCSFPLSASRATTPPTTASLLSTSSRHAAAMSRRPTLPFFPGTGNLSSEP